MHILIITHLSIIAIAIIGGFLFAKLTKKDNKKKYLIKYTIFMFVISILFSTISINGYFSYKDFECNNTKKETDNSGTIGTFDKETKTCNFIKK